jgi:thioredoxin reductase
VAQLSDRPFPPGDYPVVVVGSGPGGLQTSYCLTRLGIPHATLSADDAPGGMFRRWPIFQRLLSWTKPDAPFPQESEEFEWYDHNSLLGDAPEHRALVAGEMDRTWMVPSRAEMERGLAAFAEQGGVEVRYGCTWESTARLDDGTFVLGTTDGEYRCGAVVFATGVTTPWRSPIQGIDQVAHYVDCRRAEDYRGKTVFLIGKRNSGFEIADALEPWAQRVILCSPRPVASAVIALATIRVRYFQPYEDASWGGGTLVLDAAIERIERAGDRWKVFATGTTRPCDLELEADEVIAATGFTTPFHDLVELGVATVAQGRIPALTPFWESVTVPGIYFAGNATQGAAGLRKHGIGGASGTVSGARYNARILARHLSETRFGVRVERPSVAAGELVPLLLHELAHGPALWNQKGYLARVVTLDASAGARDEGVLPLQHFVDSAGPDAIAATVEMNAAGEIYPVCYLRRGGEIERELVLDPDPLHAFAGAAYRRGVAELAGVAA